MATPTSTLFGTFDWNSRAALTADAGDAPINDVSNGALAAASANGFTRHTTGIEGVGDSTGLLLVSPVLATMKYAVPVPTSRTFEFDVSFPDDLPADFSDQDNRVFIGVVDSTGTTSGYLFSQKGIALAPSPFTPQDDVIYLAGSADRLYSGGVVRDSITVRDIHDVVTGKSTVYITDTSDVYETDTLYGSHSFGYTVTPQASVLDEDQVLVAVRSKNQAAGRYSIRMGSLRLGTGTVNTPDSPVASAEHVDSVTVGRRIKLDARGSYDPEGQALTYHWEIEEHPVGADLALRGGVNGTVTLGTAGPNNQVTFTAVRATAKLDSTRVHLRASTTASAPISAAVSNTGDVVITLGTTTGVITSTPLDIIAVLTNKSAHGYDAAAAAIVTASLPTGTTGLGACVVESGALAGGKGSTRSLTSLYASKGGIYRFSLRVSNGERVSPPEIITVQSSLDAQLLGHRPNSDYLFMGLSDFWNLVNDRATISTAWSAASQVISGELIKLLQNDYAKSLTDISRKYQRRWLSYRMRIPVPTELQSAPVNGSGAHYFIEPDTSFLNPNSGTETFATTVSTGTVVDPDTLAAATLTTPIIARAHATVVNPSGYTGKAIVGEISSTAPHTIKFTSKAMNGLEVIDSGDYGLGFEDPAAAVGDATTDYFTVRGSVLKTGAMQVGDLLVMEYGGSVISRTLTDVTVTDPITNIPLSSVVRFDSAEGKIIADNAMFRWQIVRRVSYCQMFQHPRFSLGSTIDLRPMQFKFGDIAEIRYTSPDGGAELTAQLPILHVTSTEVFVDWRPFFSDLNAAVSATLGAGAPPQEFSAANPQGMFLTTKLVALIRSETIPLRDDVVAIPQMGVSTVAPSLYENGEYTISGSELAFEPILAQSASVTAGSNVLTLTTSVDPEIDIANVIVTDGEIGNYQVLGISYDGKRIVVSHTFNTSGTVAIRAPRYGFNSDIPDTLWAELTYFDNWRTIEGNFGLLAGLPKYLLDDAGVDLDYKSIVQACWFAFMSGPQVSNLKLASEAFLGLPFTDVAGQVTVVNPNHSTTEGRIVVKRPGQSGYVTYFYPSNYPIAVNPTTGRTITAATLEFADTFRLSAEQQAELVTRIDNPETPIAKSIEYSKLLDNARIVDDSTIPAYTSLVDAVQVFDYVSEPEKIASILTGTDVLTRTHCFVVQIPSAGLSNLNFLPILKDFVHEWKPAHTAVLFFGAIALSEDIDVDESVAITATLRVGDSPHTFQVVKDSDNTKTWPTGTTYENNPDTILWDYDDVVEKYESSYVAGVLDDYSGDGSWNATHSTVDMVNSLDSDVDVVNSKMWVPLVIDTTTVEFVLGEEVELLDVTDTPITGVGWDTGGAAPGGAPRIMHIGSGNHPKIPFSVHSPQFDHPHTYVILEFYDDGGANNSGSTNRLKPLGGYGAATVLKLRGTTSLAVGTIKATRDRNGVRVDNTSVYPDFDKAIDPDDDDYLLHKPYFLLEYVFELDKLIDTGPRHHTENMVTQYVPLGGLARGGGAPELDQVAFEINDLQAQVHPHDPTIIDGEQKVPSYNPGFFSQWDNEAAAALLTWGWNANAASGLGVDPGELAGGNVHTLFDSDGTHAPIENLHIGRRVKVWKDEHITHGFIDFVIPGPDIRSVSSIGPLDWRIEGYYFVDVDTTMVATPTSDPTSFDGAKGGTWVFYHNQSTGVETPADVVTFETGNHATKTVLGISGAQQVSDGHILNAHVAALPAQGWYDIIVRNYRPYQLVPAGPTLYHMDEDRLDGVLYYNAAAGFGGGGFGAVPFGGA